MAGAIKIRPLIVVFQILAFLFFLHPPVTMAQARKIVILKSADLAPYNTAVKGIKDILGQDLSVYDMDRDEEKGKQLVDQFVSSGVQAILAVGLPAAMAASTEQSSVPVVFSMVLYSDKQLVSGSNVTGIFMDVPVGSQFRVLKEAFPHLARIGVIYDPDNTGDLVDQAIKVASSLKLKLVAVSVTSPREVPQALRTILPQIDCLWMVPDRKVFPSGDSFDYMNKSAFESRIPFLVFSREFVEAGGLLALSPDYREIGHESARLAEKVSGGIPASDIQPRFSSEYQLVINLKAAEQIGVKFPASVLSLAKIIQ